MNIPARPYLVAALGEPCPYCGNPMQLPERAPSVDHVFIPRSEGGGTWAGNRLVVCHPCNSEKADLSAWRWRKVLKKAGDPRADLVKAAAIQAKAAGDVPALGSAQG